MAAPDEDDAPGGPVDAAGRRRLHGAPAVRLHLTLAVGLALCISAFIFEVGRALGGNSLSWAYVFEWPIFAVFAVYMWWNLLHDTDEDRTRHWSAMPTDGTATTDSALATRDDAVGDSAVGGTDDDPDLAAWKAYLRTMEAEERRQAREDGVG